MRSEKFDVKFRTFAGGGLPNRGGCVGFRLTAKLSLILTKPNCRRSLNDLPLADFNNNGDNNLNIDILIGGDFYWSFVSGNIQKGGTGTIALETTLGWVMSGNVGVSSFKNEHVTTSYFKIKLGKGLNIC